MFENEAHCPFSLVLTLGFSTETGFHYSVSRCRESGITENHKQIPVSTDPGNVEIRQPNYSYEPGTVWALPGRKYLLGTVKVS